MNAEEAYLFRHALVRQAAYQLQTPLQRAQVHRLALEILEQMPGLNRRAMANELAEHAEAALADLPETEREPLQTRLLHHLEVWADYARFSFQYEASLAALEKLLPLLVNDQARTVRAIDIMADVLQRSGRHAEAVQWFARLRDAAGDADAGYRGRALVHLAWDAHERGELKAAGAYAHEGEALQAAHPDPRLAIAFTLFRAKERAHLGDPDGAIALQQSALKLAQETNDLMQAIVAHMNLAEAMMLAGRLDAASEQLGEAESLASPARLAFWQAQIRMARAEVLRRQQKHAESAAELADVSRFARQTGSMGLLALSLCRQGQAALDLGDPVLARRCALEAHGMAEEHGDAYGLRESERLLAECR